MKLIIIGCPGSGKSTLSKRLHTLLNYPLMHLDKIYHLSGKSHISRKELTEKVDYFANTHCNWIIDGNYISTLELRVKLSDTVILFNIPSNICLKNIYNRHDKNLTSGINRDDIASEFDGSITEDFVRFIENFEVDTLPKIESILKKYPDKKVYRINNYDEVEIYCSLLSQK